MLEYLQQAWPRLQPHIRDAILTLVDASLLHIEQNDSDASCEIKASPAEDASVQDSHDEPIQSVGEDSNAANASPDEQPWDDWYRRAVEAGAIESVAALGKHLIRVITAHAWSADQQAEFGWYEDGQAMVDMALLLPELVVDTWSMLLDEERLRRS